MTKMDAGVVPLPPLSFSQEAPAETVLWKSIGPPELVTETD